MTGKSRLLLLLAVALILGGLLYLDQSGEDDSGPVRPVAQPRRAPQGTTGQSAEKPEVPDSLPRDGGSGGQPSPLPGSNPLARITLRDLAATNARPLFAPDRKPVPEPAAPIPPAVVEAPAPPPEPEPDEQAPPIEIGNFDLLGVVSADGQTIALLRYKPTNSLVRVRQGEVVEGWTVERIGRRRIVLQQRDVKDELRLFTPEEG
jgi:hypothetical protein